MNVGVFATRLAGTDGVSLEAAKIAEVLQRRGHRVFSCAGELDANLDGTVVEGMHFNDPTALDHVGRAFGDDGTDPTLLADIEAHAHGLEQHLRQFLEDYDIDFAVVQNVFAIPMHLSLAKALHKVLTVPAVPTLAHNHDFHWERDRFSRCRIPDFLDEFFPPVAPNIEHATINTIARRELSTRKGVFATVVPNVFDFATAPPGIDNYNADFRRAIGVSPSDTLILQPTRVVPRKQIELAVELVARLDDPTAKLVITHEASDEGVEYLERLRSLANGLNVQILHVADIVESDRGRSAAGNKLFSLWDAYPHADFVTYPSAIEGFGNALIETVYFGLPALVNRYPVYEADIAPLGFRFVECDNEITDRVVSEAESLLASPEARRLATEHNYRLGATHFSLEALDGILGDLVPS